MFKRSKQFSPISELLSKLPLSVSFKLMLRVFRPYAYSPDRMVCTHTVQQYAYSRAVWNDLKSRYNDLISRRNDIISRGNDSLS